MAGRPSYIFLSQFQPKNMASSSSSNCASKTMASSVPETTVCWLTFSSIPLSVNHEALARLLGDMLGGGPMRVVRTELSKIEVVTLLLHPSMVPMVIDVIV